MPDCYDCNFLDLTDRNKYGEAYCCHYSMKKYTSLDGSCRYFDRRYYLTSVTCEVLNLPKGCAELDIIGKFIDEYMPNNKECKDFLQEYDEVGPFIAFQIKKDSESIEITTHMHDDFIVPTMNFIAEKRYDEALATYILMFNLLKARYCLFDDKNIDTIKVKRIRDFKF